MSIDFPLLFAHNGGMALTRRQKQVLDFIAGFLEQNGYSPSYEEIARGLDLASLATVHKHIAALDNKHYLKRGINQSRSLDLSPKYFQEVRKHRQGAGGLDIPLLGRIAAARPWRPWPARSVWTSADFLKSRQCVRTRGARQFHDRGPHHERRLGAGREHAPGARRRNRGGAGARCGDHTQTILPGVGHGRASQAG